LIADRLEIIALGGVRDTPGLLDWLASEIETRFGFREIVRDSLADDPLWSEQGDQLSSNRIIDSLIGRSERQGVYPSEQWTLAITDADLTAPGRDYVFGEATLDGGWALVSTARLGDTAADVGQEAILRRRLLREVTHELGHLAGLRHCQNRPCVMHPAVTPADADLNGAEFCRACRPDYEGE
jgi:predicted Zn-dependent protease